MHRIGLKVNACSAAAVALAALMAAGCSSVEREGRSYPRELSQSRVPDIQVSRRGTKVYLTNTTAVAFGAGTLWINGLFSAPTPPMGIGETLELDLRGFVDEFGGPFRAGGFFATRDPDPVILAQLEVDGRLVGFVVVENRY